MKINSKNYSDNQINWLHNYIDAELKSVREAVTKVEFNNKEAVDKVERTYSDYRSTQNEWRGQIKDQTTTFVTRRELWAAVLATITILITTLVAIYK